MRQPFTYSYERFSGLLEDRLAGQIYAESREQAALMLVAELHDFNAATESEALTKAEAYLTQKTGIQSVKSAAYYDDLSSAEIWDVDGATCYRDLHIQEELPNSYAQ